MSERLTAEREAQIREWASVVASNWGRENYHDLLAELDALRADVSNYDEALKEWQQRAERAEAILAAIRVCERYVFHGLLGEWMRSKDVLALLDAARPTPVTTVGPHPPDSDAFHTSSGLDAAPKDTP